MRRLPVLLAALALAGCSSTGDSAGPACPPVKILDEARTVTQFKDGRDVTDAVYEAEILGYKGSCQYGEKGVNVRVSVAFKVGLGPAADSRTVKIPYFVAVPDFYPAESAKKKLTLKVPFPKGQDVIRLRDGEIGLDIPLDKPGQGAETPVVVGFQLSPEQLDYNRTRSGR